MELKGSTVCVSTLVKAHKDYYQVSLLTQLFHTAPWKANSLSRSLLIKP